MVPQLLAKRIFLIFLFCSIINGTIGNIRNNNNNSNVIHSSSNKNADSIVSNTEATLNGAVNRSSAIFPILVDNDDNNQKTNDNDNNDDHDEIAEDPIEIQKAVCTVTAGEVKASAEAATTKVLKGVCGSVEMHLALRDLELKFLKELEEIKMLLTQNLEHTKAKKIPATNTKPTGNSLLEIKPTSLPPLLKDNAEHDNDDVICTTISQIRKCDRVDNTRSTTRGPQLKSSSRWQKNSREYQVLKFNNTLLSDQDLRVFTYYWKLENISEHLINGSSSKILESPIFSIKGKHLRIKAFFHHLQRDFLYLQLAYALLNATKSANNINLDTGGLFKKIASDHFQFNYKILILDQSNHYTQDLVSQEFVNLEKGFLIPNSALLNSSFIKKNSLLIQVFLYM